MTIEKRPASTMACTGRSGSGSEASRSSRRKTGREETQAWAATIAIVNCIARVSRFQTPLAPGEDRLLDARPRTEDRQREG